MEVLGDSPPVPGAAGKGAVPVNEPTGKLTGNPYPTDSYRLALWVTDS